MAHKSVDRDAKDFAIEFGEYLAKEAEEFLVFMNRHGLSAGKGATTDSQSEMTDRWRGLTSAIYEFRKRAIKAALPTSKGPEK